LHAGDVSAALTQVALLIQRETGIVVRPAQHAALEAAIARVGAGMTPERLLAGAGSGDLMQRLIDEVTVRETFFFRHRAELDAIDWPEALRTARARGSDVVRVWVAGCASGEEAYSVAALACESYASATPPVRIIASDIAMPALAQARRGRYGARAAGLVPELIRQRYFVSDGDHLEVGTSLRALVDVVLHNLVRAVAPPGVDPVFDVILCRNVLIYFDVSTVARVLRLLERTLAPGGTLVLGAADRLARQPWRVADRAVQADVQVRAASPPEADRRAPTREPPRAWLVDALKAADHGDVAVALQITSAELARDPLSAAAYYVRGIAQLAADDADAAVISLRRALYADPNFSAAAFKLARAHDALGEVEAAAGAYRRTLRALDSPDTGTLAVLHPTDRGDLVVACHTRLSAMSRP
jgi:chemotaxis methyl-accepting protein methylase